MKPIYSIVRTEFTPSGRIRRRYNGTFMYTNLQVAFNNANSMPGFILDSYSDTSNPLSCCWHTPDHSETIEIDTFYLDL